MVIDITPKKFTLESAYYECCSRVYDAISNDMITALTESAGSPEVLNEGFKETFKNIINKIVTALRNLKDKIVKKFNEIKAKIKGKKEIADKVDEATKKVEDTFEDERKKIESISVDDQDDASKATTELQKQADSAAESLKKSAESSSRDISKLLKSLRKKTDNIETLDDYREVGQSIIDIVGDDMDAFARSLSKEDLKGLLDVLDKRTEKKDDAIAGSIVSKMKKRIKGDIE